MTRLVCLVCLLVAITSACVISAPVSPTIRATPENTLTPPILPIEKPSKMQNGYSTTVTAEKWLYVRSSASHYAEVVGYLMNGEYVVVYECRGTWGRVGTGRWVNTVYLDKGCE